MGIKITRGVKDINHAQFVDDTLLLWGASTIIARKFKQQLDLYKEASGSQINYKKIQIFVWNYKPREMVDIARIMEMEGETQWDSFKYLGVPISNPSLIPLTSLSYLTRLKPESKPRGLPG
jgi:hypothetical protein